MNLTFFDSTKRGSTHFYFDSTYRVQGDENIFDIEFKIQNSQTGEVFDFYNNILESIGLDFAHVDITIGRVFSTNYRKEFTKRIISMIDTYIGLIYEFLETDFFDSSFDYSGYNSVDDYIRQTFSLLSHHLEKKMIEQYILYQKKMTKLITIIVIFLAIMKVNWENISLD